jgi:hypothetical protein
MKELVLLGDEVALLKFAAKQGVLSRTGPTLGHEIACAFFVESGLAERHGDELRLTDFGQRLVNRLLETSSAGTVAIPRSVLEELGAPLAG